MRGKFKSLRVFVTKYNIYTSVPQLIRICGPLFNNVRTLNQRLEQMKFQIACGTGLCLSKYCSDFSSSSSNIFYVTVFNVISASTGNFCSEMIISTHSAQNLITSKSESSSSVLVFDTFDSCYN